MKADEGHNGAPRIFAEPTKGDFGHTRRRSVRLACCSCTCCCFTLLGGGIGLIGGAIKGIVASLGGTRTSSDNVLIDVLLATLRFLGFVVVYAIGGLLLGAAVGGAIDYLWFGLLK